MCGGADHGGPDRRDAPCKGVAGGLLAGLGYALINSTLPSSLWTRGSALVSAMWGVATLVGPAIGGLFAQFGSWRWAFGAMAILTALRASLVPRRAARRPNGHDRRETVATRVPYLVAAAAGCRRGHGQRRAAAATPVATAALLAAAVLLVGIFVIVDWRMHAAVLPPSVFGRGPLKWIYLTMAVLMVVAMVDTYVPLFGSAAGTSDPARPGFWPRRWRSAGRSAEMVSASLEQPQGRGG